MPIKYDQYGNYNNRGWTLNANGVQVDSSGNAVSYSGDYPEGSFIVGQPVGMTKNEYLQAQAQANGSGNLGTGINYGTIPLSQVRKPDGSLAFPEYSSGSSGSYSSTTTATGQTGSSPYQAVPATGTWDSGDKYAKVGPTSNTYNPDWMLYYERSPTGQAYYKAVYQIAKDLDQKPTYDNKYDLQLEAAYKNIVNRDPFSYNAETDPLYGTYKDRYTQLGRQAMRDAMGQAAALTGGYGSTYGQFVGQSAYGKYMDALADKSLELEDRAYQRWKDAGNELYKQYSLLGDLRDTEYGRYRDAVSDYNHSLALAQAQEAEDYERQKYNNELHRAAEQAGYNRYRDAITDARYEDELGYSRWRDTVSDNRYENELGYSRWRDSVSDARYEDETAYARSRDAVADSQWEQEFGLKQANAAANAAGGSSGGSSSGGSSRSGGGSGSGSSGSGYSKSVTMNGSSYSGTPDWWTNMGDAQRRALQQQLGTAADGVWGPNTAAAYEKFIGSSGPATYTPSGNNGYDYSLNGYTGEQIYASLADEARQAKLEADMLDLYVKKR